MSRSFVVLFILTTSTVVIGIIYYYLMSSNKKNKSSKKNKRKKLKYNAISKEDVPLFKINLETPAIHRWTHILRLYHQQILKLYHSILGLDTYQMSEREKAENPNFLHNLSEGILQRLRNLGAKELVLELKGIAKYFQENETTISLDDILIIHLLYESMCGCTTIVTKDESKAKLLMGRTLDWMNCKYLRELTIDVDVYRGELYLYRFTTFAGFIGCLTALKINEFSFAINFREFSTNMKTEENEIDIHLKNDCWPIAFLGRYICENVHSYDQALDIWMNAPLMAPSYIIIMDELHAMQITRDENSSINPLSLSVISNAENVNGYCNECKNDGIVEDGFLLQTNIDHWLGTETKKKSNCKSKKNQNKRKKRKRKSKQMNEKIKQEMHDVMDSKQRLACARLYLKSNGENMDCSRMWEMLDLYPIHDKLWTVYSNVIEVKSNYYKTVRHLYS